MTVEKMPEHVARVVSERARAAVRKKDKETWLSFFSEEAVIEDPVGKSLLDPEGGGHRGKDAISSFWDANIAPNTIEFNFRDSYDVGKEIAYVGSLTTTGGENSLIGHGASITVDGVFVYKVNNEGEIVSLRAFWEFDKAMSTLNQPAS